MLSNNYCESRFLSSETAFSNSNQGGIKYFTLWQRAVFIKYYARHSANLKVLNGPQLTCNATKCLFGTLKCPLRGISIGCMLTFIHLINKLHIYCDNSGISTKYFVLWQRFCGNLVSRFPVIIPPCCVHARSKNLKFTVLN